MFDMLKTKDTRYNKARKRSFRLVGLQKNKGNKVHTVEPEILTSEWRACEQNDYLEMQKITARVPQSSS